MVIADVERDAWHLLWAGIARAHILEAYGERWKAACLAATAELLPTPNPSLHDDLKP